MSEIEKTIDKIHNMRKEAQKNALIEEMILHSELGECKHSIEQLYDLASNEFFTIDEKEEIQKCAVKEFERQFSVKVINQDPLLIKAI